MEQTQPNSLDELLKTEESAEQVTTEQLFSVVTDTLGALEGSLGSLHVSIRSLNTRIGTLENFVAFLLSENPKTADKFKELAEKAVPSESKNNDQTLPTMSKE